MDTLGIEPRASRMLSGCDTTTPCALLTIFFLCLHEVYAHDTNTDAACVRHADVQIFRQTSKSYMNAFIDIPIASPCCGMCK